MMGTLILVRLLAHLGAGRVEAAGRDLLNGAVLEAAELPPAGGRRHSAGGLHLLLSREETCARKRYC